MIRMFAKRLGLVQVVGGSDKVVFGISLPSGSRINNISLNVKLWTEAMQAVGNVTAYAVEGWILPVIDPDAAVLYNSLWDQLVPKDTDVEIVDLDTNTLDTTPFYEPGEPDWSDLLEVGLRPERIYHRHRYLSFGQGSVFSVLDTTLKYIPGDSFRIRIGKRYGIKNPSVLLFAVGMPSLDDTTSTEVSALAEQKWGQVKYIGHVLERAMMHLFGIIEAGAETPWEQATALLKEHLEPDVHEENGGTFVSPTMTVLTEGIVDHSVEGRLADATISTGR